MRSYFGVTAEESLRSGLAAYRPGGGLRDVGAGATLGYRLSRRWGLIARAGANRYLGDAGDSPIVERSEEHTSELQSLMRISYAVFCLKKKKNEQTRPHVTLKDTNLIMNTHQRLT